MKGTLHKTESGWQVWYHAKEDLFYGNTGVRILPILDHGYVNGPGLSDSDEGQEVEFRVIEFPVPPTNRLVSNSISKYAQLIGQFPEYPTKSHQLQIKIAEECFRKHPNNEELYTTDELKDAYKAGVIDGFKEWTLDSYNPPTKKQDNDNT